MTGVVPAVRRRVRLRTRWRRAREAWRRVRQRRLPVWSDGAPPRVSPGSERAEIVVERAGELRRLARRELVREILVTVRQWQAPAPGWSGRLGPLPGVRRHEVVLPGGGRGPATVSVVLDAPLPVDRVAVAVLPALVPLRVPATVVAGGDAGPVMVDAGAANPGGRQRYGRGLPAGELRPGGADGWEIVRVPDGTPVVAGRYGAPLDERQRSVLAELGRVTVPPSRRSRSSARQNAGFRDEQLLDRRDGGVVAQLAMTGVVLDAPDGPDLAGGLAKGLAKELAGIVTAPLPGDDPLEWEIRSVRQRRAAMRHHAAWLSRPLVSAMLVTKRPELAVGQVAVLAAQTYPELEIVVGMHGADPPAGLRAAAGDRLLRIAQVPAERNLGQVLQEVTALARGTMLTKVDDDDRYGPEHIWDLVLAHHFSGAALVGKGAEFVYLEPEYATVRRRMGAEFFTDTVAGGTLTLGRDELAAVGGWPPVPRYVDRALLDRVLEAGGLVYRTHPIGFIYTRHGNGHTWQADADYFRHDTRQTWRGLPPQEEFGTA